MRGLNYQERIITEVLFSTDGELMCAIESIYLY